MAFTVRLNSLIDALGCTNLQIAEASFMHLSSVRRLRGGEQPPVGKNKHNRNKQVLKLSKGLILLAEKNGRTDKLRGLCGLPEDEELTPELLFAWFKEEELSAGESGGEKYRRGRTQFRHFAHRFSAVMKLLGISGMRLSSAVNIDPSLISRFKKGVRMPYDELVRTICDYLYDRAIISGKLSDFCTLLKIEEMTAVSDRELTIKNLYNFLAASEEEKKSSHMVDDFIARLSSVTSDRLSSAPIPEALTAQDILDDTEETYCGTEGLRRAVIRLLCSTINSDKPETLLLYSDQCTNWMTDDPEFAKKWEQLMLFLVQRKHKVRIVHNINRNLQEIFRAINKWIPIYMSGQIESRYNKRNPGSSFSHTLFINGSSAISSCISRGTEENGVYHYTTGNSLKYHREQFASILESSGSLVRIFKRGDTEALLSLNDDISSSRGKAQRLLCALPVETLPEDIFAAMAGRHCQNPKATDKLIKQYRAKKRSFEKLLENGGVSEYICLSHSENGVLDTSGLFLDTPIHYEAGEYALHLENTMRLLDENKNYDIGLLDEPPFHDIQISVKRESGALLVKDRAPSVAVNFRHTMMTSAFFEYMSDIRERAAVLARSGADVTAYLEKKRNERQ